MYDIAIAHYNTVREEILSRMSMRQSVLALYIGFVGTLFGYAFVDSHPEVGIVIPVVTFGVSLIICDHEIALARLNRWLCSDYQAFLDKRNLSIPQWDNGTEHDKYSSGLVIRFFSYFILFVAASVAGVILANEVLIETHGWLACGTFALTLGSVVNLAITLWIRLKSGLT